MYIAAVLPPNNAEMNLLRFKRDLFKETSAVSLWALKPIIPFAFTEELPEPLQRKDLPELPTGGLLVKSPAAADYQYILGSSQCSEFCSRLKVLFSSCKGFRPGLNGLHLFDTRDNGTIDAEAVEHSVSESLSALEDNVLIWKSCSLGVLRLDSEPFFQDKWWTRVVLSDVYELKFPKTPKQ